MPNEIEESKDSKALSAILDLIEGNKTLALKAKAFDVALRTEQINFCEEHRELLAAKRMLANADHCMSQAFAKTSVKAVYPNEKLKTVAVVFKNGKTRVIRLKKDDRWDVAVTVAIAVAEEMNGGSYESFAKMVSSKTQDDPSQE